MAHPLHVVDVFAEARWEGNPVSVVLEAGDLSGEAMQAIARETNHSETTFVTAPAARDGAWPVRIFTPAFELPFAGHPTLGTAWVIRRRLERDAPSQVVLDLGVGRVPVDFEAGADGGELAWLTAPPIELGQQYPPEIAARVLGLDVKDLDPRAPVQRVSAGIVFTFVPLRNLAALRRIRLDLAALGEFDMGAGFYSFCSEAEDPRNHVRSRLLFDAGGVREDPATGSAAACLGAYLLDHGLLGEGPLALRIEQGHEVARPSLLHLRAETSGGERKIGVGGAVVPALEGHLL